MPNEDDIQQQFALLRAHRQTLANYLTQKAQQGQAFTTPAVLNGIIEARQHIAHIKKYLRSQQCQVEDFNIDDEFSVDPKIDELKSTAFHIYRASPSIVVSNYQPLTGKWDFTDKSIRYIGPDKRNTQIPHGIILIKNLFTEGVVETTVSFSKMDPNNCARILFGYDHGREISEYYTVGVGGYRRAFVLSRFDPKIGWLCTDFYGSHYSLELLEYRLRLEVKGINFTATVNSIEIFKGRMEGNNLIRDGRFGFFTWGEDEIEFKDISLSRK